MRSNSLDLYFQLNIVQELIYEASGASRQIALILHSLFSNISEIQDLFYLQLKILIT